MMDSQADTKGAPPQMEMTVDRALIYSILKGGLPAFRTAKDLGIEASHLTFDDQHVFRIVEEFFAPKGRVPSLAELKLHFHIDIPACPEAFDADLCAKQIVKRTLATRLSDGLGPIEQDLTSDPFASRAKLQELIQQTNWSMGKVARTNSQAAIEEIRNRYLDAKAHDGSLLGYSSPWPLRDKQSLGLQSGEVTAILAKRKSGKSFMVCAWANHIWTNTIKGQPELKSGECILIVTMEMPVWQILRRLFAVHMKLSYSDFRAGRLAKADEDRFLAFCEERKNPDPTRPEVIVMGSDKIRTVRDLVAVVAQYQPKVVFIDGFYILGREGKGKQAPLWERTMNNIAEIKLDVAVAHNVPVVATTQLGGQVKRGDLHAEADAVAYSKSIGDYADAVDGLFANDQCRSMNLRILRGMEAREFVPIDLKINFDIQKMNFAEIGVAEPKTLPKHGKSDDDQDEDSDGELPIC